VSIILRVLKVEVSVYNVYIKTSLKPLLFKGWESSSEGGKVLRPLSQLLPRIRPKVRFLGRELKKYLSLIVLGKN
jgi:hypothetical protein